MILPFVSVQENGIILGDYDHSWLVMVFRYGITNDFNRTVFIFADNEKSSRFSFSITH